MRQLSRIALSIFILYLLMIPSYGAYKGGVSYSIPIVYDNLSENEIKPLAHNYFYAALDADDGVLNDDITQALNLYTILQKINPQNISYSIKLGILYDKLGKDRYARANYAHAVAINPNKAVAYYYYGEYYYKREQYRQALRYYKKALERLEKPSYELYYKLGDVYQKFGDTKMALKYLNLANEQRPSAEINSKLEKVKAIDVMNSIYYKD